MKSHYTIQSMEKIAPSSYLIHLNKRISIFDKDKDLINLNGTYYNFAIPDMDNAVLIETNSLSNVFVGCEVSFM